jgi:hypothetical protein
VLYKNMIKPDEGEPSSRCRRVHRARDIVCRLQIARASCAGGMRTHWRVCVCEVFYGTQGYSSISYRKIKK